MWTVLGLNDFALLERHVAVMRQMDQRYGTLSVPNLRSVLAHTWSSTSEFIRWRRSSPSIRILPCRLCPLGQVD
jgi:hypothetical protein